MALQRLQDSKINPSYFQDRNPEHAEKRSGEETSSNEPGSKEISDPTTFPEGGARALAVAAGAAGVLFCTLGYSNAFG
jgi:hypothetical protein